MWMLDTNICIFLIKRRPLAALTRLKSLDITDVCVSAITVAELQFGAEKSARPEQNRLAVAAMLAPLRVLPFDDDAAAVYGSVRAGLERAGTPIGGMDLLIGAHALATAHTLVTHNTREFVRIPNLKVEDWAG